MPRVMFFPNVRILEIETGTRLFDAAHSAGLPVASSCDGEFVCGKCVMRVLEHPENLSAQEPDERELLAREKNPLTWRVSCRARILGDCTVTTKYW